jgi:hypothetical protein
MQHSALETVRARWLDRLWGELFAEGEGLLSPREIRTERLDREKVRAAELASIETAERESAELSSGRMLRDVSGQFIDAVAVGEIPMFSIIERPPADDDVLMARVAQPERMLHSVVSDIARQDLRGSLNLRRVALLAETEIYIQEYPQPVGNLRPSAQWLRHWRQLAQQSFVPHLQRLWARLVVHEVAAPGRYPLAVLDVLSRIGERELRGIRLLASYSFREFIFDARESYFEPDMHGLMVKTAADLGLFRADGQRFWLKINRQQVRRDPQLLICNNRALQIRTLPVAGISIPVIRISEVGKQIFRLCEAHADMAYLLDMAGYLQARGAEVALGDWRPYERSFDKRLDVA